MAVVGDSYSEQFTLQRVLLTAQVLNTKPQDLPAGATRALAATEAEARRAGISGEQHTRDLAMHVEYRPAVTVACG